MSALIEDPPTDVKSLWYSQWRNGDLSQNSSVDFAEAFADDKIEKFEVSQDVTPYGATYARCFFKLIGSDVIYVSVPMEAPFTFTYVHKRGWVCSKQKIWHVKYKASIVGDTHMSFKRRDMMEVKN